MLITCPTCRQTVDVGARRPGRYRGTCLDCSSSFVAVVPASPAAPVRVLAQPQPNGRAAARVAPKAATPAVDCPECRQPLDLGHPPAGRYHATCPECRENIGIVAAEANGRVRLIPATVGRAPAAKRHCDFPTVPRPAAKPLPPTLRHAYLPEDEPPAKPLPPTLRRPYGSGDDDLPAMPLSPTLRRPYLPEDANGTVGHDGGALPPDLPPERDDDRPLEATRPASGSVTLDEDTEGWEDDFAPTAPPQPGTTAAGRGSSGGDDFSVAGEATELAGDAPDAVPTRLGGYEVIKVLGQGGMGSVLLGRQISLNRNVALKVMHPKIATNPAFAARFTREAFAAAQLAHHNVVQVYDIGEQKGRHFFSMEFVRGQNLTDVIRSKGPLAPEVAAGYALQAARGLRAGHSQGMIHRDVKPANLLLNEDGVLKVADLGLVKFSADGAVEPAPPGDPTAAPHLTAAGSALGTPAYMAPEQATDSSGVDERADVYSLGCTLYALVTGRPPFEGATALEVMTKHLTEPVVPPDVIVKRVPAGLSAVLLQMLAKDPAERYQSMDEVVAALEEFLGVPRADTFSPREEDADQLEGHVAEYHARSRTKTNRVAGTAFAVACLAALAAAAVTEHLVGAVAALGLLVTAPLAYAAARGARTGGALFSRVRALVLGTKLTDWVMAAGVAVLLTGALYLFGLLWAGIGVALLGAGLGVALWYATDRPEAAAQREPLDGVRALCRRLRLQGLSEGQVRDFVSKFGGPGWEAPFEELFGYEALVAARAARRENTGEVWHRHAAWRDPLVTWADARLEARRQARERDLLHKVESKALEAEGLSRTEAAEQAAELAVAMVDQAAAAKKARSEGRAADIRGVVAAARTRHPEYARAARKLRTLGLRTFFDKWFGRWARFVLGAALFATGLLWMHQNQLLTAANPVLRTVLAGDPLAALDMLTKPTGSALVLPVVPRDLSALVDSYKVALTGVMLLVSAVFFAGWRATLPAVLGVAAALYGAELELPAAGPLTPALTGLVLGGALILPLGWLLRN